MKRLKSRKAHAENPHSRTHRMISNVRRRGAGRRPARDPGELHRAPVPGRDHQSYVGRYEHLLEVTDTGLRFRLRRAVLVNEAMAAGARLSFIL